MAKAMRAYTGTDSYGRHIEVAQSVSGAWYSRQFGWNGFANGWSKWQAMEAPKHPERVRNMCEYADAPEYVEIPVEHQQNRIEWGFNTLHIFTDTPKFRLPE